MGLELRIAKGEEGVRLKFNDMAVIVVTNNRGAHAHVEG